MPHSNNRHSQLHQLIHQAKVHISNDATGVIDKLIPEKHGKLVKQAKPMFSMFGIPTPDIMLTNIFEQMDGLEDEFWLNLESMIIGVINGEQESRDKLLALIGAIQNEHQH